MAQTKLHLDWESFSAVDIRAVGAYRYANDPSTEILCAGMAIDDEEPVVWYPGVEDAGAFSPKLNVDWDRYWNALEDPLVLVWAHNAMFEMAIGQALMQKTWNIKCPALSRFRCTASLARRAALPAKLEKLAEVLNLPQQKDTRGKALIRKFCQLNEWRVSKRHPQGGIYRVLPSDEPEAFKELCDYCAQDVRVEQSVLKKLSYFDDPINSANYSLDAIINARGVTVNLDALRHAQKLIDEETEIVSAKFRALTGVEFTQNAQLLQWLKPQGYQFNNLLADSVEAYLEGYEGLPDDQAPPAVIAMRLRQSVSYASIKKVRSMIACCGPHDNRLRGLLTHHGAGTGRWTASLVQIQNFRRSTMKSSEQAYREICNGISREMLELCYGPPLEVIANCIRHFIDTGEETLCS